ncbi:hypothetical protein EVAR_100493_1 [Eumeta japonica]|uniref:Uncharacterized protein n=1 Tax=Eumeta variegata TaxID=151549 RepID=A0A4C1ZWA5_EUMVA|nr:hypothetical protein EVAR_100493_1 [Eumeta japonica]
MHPAKLQTFVLDRVAEILENTGNHTWRHVPTNENLADRVPRGVDPKTVNGLDLWWGGHVARLSDNHKTTSWAGPLGQRKRKTKCTLVRQYYKEAGIQWTRAAEDREYWSFLESLCMERVLANTHLYI